ncbi:MAG: ATP-binding protein [Elusimicrobia bacterium]|nr:ATP-binding protein [Elusimicrobiota bacterium]
MNPFKYGRVVSADDFCPRPALLKQLTGFIRSGQNVEIQGERRMGKTSLIYESVRQMKRLRMLYVDMLEIKTADDLCKRMVKALISMEQQAGFLERVLKSVSQLRPVVSVDPVTGQPSVSLDAAVRMRPDSIDGLLDLIHSVHKKTPLVVVFDEFQDILNLPDAKATLSILRSRIQFHKDMAYIFAGSVRNQMSEIFTDPESAFFKSAVSVDVGPLDTDAFARFLADKFTLGKRSVDSGLMKRVVEIAESVPGDVQELCGALWETTSYKDAMREANIGAALELIYARESKGYESVLVQLTGQQLKCLAGLARMGGKAPQSSAFVHGIGLTLPASVKKALNRLVQLKIIYRHQGEYKFVNPFLKSWLIWKNY